MMKLTIQTNPYPANTTSRSPLIVPKEHEKFAKSFNDKYAQGLFLGATSSENKSNQRAQFNRTRCLAKVELSKGISALEPTQHALERTQRAAKDFFSLSYQFLDKNDLPFPLAGLNKCLGMVAIPSSKVVMIAISQDKDPRKDEALRKNMIELLDQLNQTTNDWIFELACIPTKAQYLMPRTLFMRFPHQASQEIVKPHTRCVEVALMAALCKARRCLTFTSADTGTIAFGGTLWASSDNSEAIPHFEGATRNIKYRIKKPLEVKLTDAISGWIDLWEPCPEHCKIYKYEMLAIGAAGGCATSFTEPRSEWMAPKGSK